jgi:uncharacterized membrane protein HdeD (DUF308 family)
MRNCVPADIFFTPTLTNDVRMTISDEKTVFEGPLHQLARNAWQMLLLIGVLAVTLGVVVLAWPRATWVVAGVLFGIYLVVSGFGYMLAAFATHSGVGMKVLEFLTGAVSLVLGFFCFRNVYDSILFLAVWIGVGWLFRGATLLTSAIALDRVPGRGWQAFLGVVTLIGGGVLIIYPFSSAAILTLFGGWWLIVIGVVEIINALQVRHRLKAHAA